jgi:predicted HicB family RNase H-like nuclease
MSNGRPKVKTAVIQLRVDPELKAAATVAAKKDHRNLTNWIEVLILNRCKELNVPAEPTTWKEHNV